MKIPIYEQRVGLDTPRIEAPVIPEPKNPGAVRAAFGENVARANQGIADVGLKIAGALEKRQEEKYQFEQDQLETNLYNKAVLDKQDRLLSTETEEKVVNGRKVQQVRGLLNRKLGSASGTTDDYQEWSDKYLNDTLASVSDPKTRQKLYNRLDSDFTTTRERVIKHEIDEDRQDKVNTYDTGVKMALESAYTAVNQPELNIQIKNAVIAQDKKDTFLNIDEGTKALNRYDISKKVIEKSVVSRLQTDISGTESQSLLDGYRKILTEEDFNEISDTVIKSSEKMAIQSQVFQNRAESKNEEEVIKMLNDENLDVLKLKDFRGKISEKFYRSMKNSLESKKSLTVNTEFDTYEGILQSIISRDIPASEIRSNILQANAEGKLSKSDVKNLLFIERGGGVSTVEQDYLEELEDKKTKSKKTNDNFWGSVWSSIKDELSGTDSMSLLRIYGKTVKKALDDNFGDDHIKVISFANDEIRKQRLVGNPWMLKLPMNGGLLVDRYGNKAMGYPDGTIEEIQDSKGNFTPQQMRKPK
jgi:hypothetical protein